MTSLTSQAAFTKPSAYFFKINLFTSQLINNTKAITMIAMIISLIQKLRLNPWAKNFKIGSFKAKNKIIVIIMYMVDLFMFDLLKSIITI